MEGDIFCVGIVRMSITLSKSLLAFMILGRAKAFPVNQTWRQIKRPFTVVQSSKTVISDAIRLSSEKEMKKLTDHYSNRQTPPLLWQSKEVASSYINDNIDSVLFDCDGVLYRTPDAIPGAADCVENLMMAKKKVLFVTNNAGSSRSQLCDKLCQVLGTDTLSEEQMISSSFAAAKYLEANLGSRRRVHVIGSLGLCTELKSYGFDITGGPSSEKAEMGRQELADYDFPENPIDALVVGHDVEFTFRKLSIANVLMQMNPNAVLIATNRDSFDLVGADGRHIPGNGSIVAALEYCSRRKAINVGKPSTELLHIIKNEHDLDMKRTMFVGDRLDTDIKFAFDNEMVSVLVLTGVTTADKLIELAHGNDDEPLPSVIASHVGILA